MICKRLISFHLTRNELAQVVAINFFGANGRETVDGLFTGVESKLTEGTASSIRRRSAA